MATNYERLQHEIGTEHNPFIVYDIETTGIMNGLDNRITQVSLVAYDYNKQSGKYELQDQLFMLAKPDEQAIRTIQKGEKVTDENITYRLAQDFAYSFVKEQKSELQKLERKLAHDEKYPKQHSQEELDDLREEIKNHKDYLDIAMDIYKARKAMFDKNMSIDEIFSTPIVDDTISPQVLIDCHNYISQHYDEKKKEMEEATSVADTLAKQGLDLEKYIADGKGLTTAEMQIGITEFLNKYHTIQTAYVNNGTYFANHYMQKEGLTLFNHNSTDKTIDLIQAQRSMHGGSSAWTADIETFAENYKKSTGKEIKTFDALTKGLCMGEIVVKGCNMSVSLTSENYLEQKVAETAMSMDNDYVMSSARASSLNWLPDYSDRYDDADYHFSSIEYVDFGNDRRYVDIDKMFEVNDDFEITLEGEKEPIKTWKELETKIKALNSEISDSLLEKIHAKYEEITQKAEEERKDDLMNRYEMENLDISALSEEDFKFLDREYDLQHNSWAMAERHKDVKEAFIKAVENGNYEIIDLPNDQKGSQVIEKGLRVMGLSDGHGTKSYYGVIGIGNVVLLMDASIDIYDGINTNPVYSMDITFDDFDRLAVALKTAQSEKEGELEPVISEQQQAQKEQDIKSKIDGFIQRELAKVDISSDVTNEGDWEKDLGMRVELTPSPQLGKALLDYYGANIDNIIITHGENGTAVMLSGIITNEDTFYTDTFSKDFNLSERNEKAVDKLYQRWNETQPQTEQQQAEALFEELAKLRQQKTDIQNSNSENMAFIFQSFGDKMNSCIKIYSDNVKQTNHISFPIGDVVISYDKSLKFADKNGSTYDRNSTGVWNLIRENEISVDNIEKAFWKYMVNVAKEQIATVQKEVDDLQERSYVLNEMKSFTKADISVDKNKDNKVQNKGENR